MEAESRKVTKSIARLTRAWRYGRPQWKKCSAYWMAYREARISRWCRVCRGRTISNSMAPLLICLLFLLVTPLPAAHKPLVPRPQQIQYGNGRLALKGITISFRSSPAQEDRFAANELASALAEVIADPVPVVNSGTSASGIVFYRTGGVDALPGPDDRAGQDSRESYTLRIAVKSAEVRAPSSAALY